MMHILTIVSRQTKENGPMPSHWMVQRQLIFPRVTLMASWPWGYKYTTNLSMKLSSPSYQLKKVI